MQLSVIVPVYNGEKCLEKCLESLTRQNFKRSLQEVIVVNDGSTDNTEKIIDRFCKGYDYFVKVNKSNGGVSSARNVGLSVAKGDFIAFVDADDMLADNAYPTIIKLLYEKELDGLTMDFETDAKLFSFVVADEDNIGEDFSVDKSKKISNVWATVYKRKVLNDNAILFDTNLKRYEDLLFSYKFLDKAKRVGTLRQKWYFFDKSEMPLWSVDKILARWEEKDWLDGEEEYFLNSLVFGKRLKDYQEQNAGAYNLDCGIEYFAWLEKYLRKKMEMGCDGRATLEVLAELGIYCDDLPKPAFVQTSFKERLRIFREANKIRIPSRYVRACRKQRKKQEKAKKKEIAKYEF